MCWDFFFLILRIYLQSKFVKAEHLAIRKNMISNLNNNF